MLQYLIILLDDASVSFCHYDNSRMTSHPISLETLRKGVIWAMKENLNVQLVYPDEKLPLGFEEIIDTVDHSNIKATDHDADVCVMKDWKDGISRMCKEGVTYLIRTDINSLYENRETANDLIKSVSRLNIVICDMHAFKDENIEAYASMLDDFSATLVAEYKRGRTPQLNLLTDRLLLKQMNNCDAGVKSITLAPNGRFYLCPAFYFDDPDDAVGDLERGVVIPNRQLLHLDHAPLCRQCDAYQCRRCVWMNYQLTLDVNTPSHQQCVVAHVERNASKKLLEMLKENGVILSNASEIKTIDYIDPFNKYCKWK